MLVNDLGYIRICPYVILRWIAIKLFKLNQECQYSAIFERSAVIGWFSKDLDPVSLYMDIWSMFECSPEWSMLSIDVMHREIAVHDYLCHILSTI